MLSRMLGLDDPGWPTLSLCLSTAGTSRHLVPSLHPPGRESSGCRACPRGKIPPPFHCLARGQSHYVFLGMRSHSGLRGEGTFARTRAHFTFKPKASQAVAHPRSGRVWTIKPEREEQQPLPSLSSCPGQDSPWAQAAASRKTAGLGWSNPNSQQERRMWQRQSLGVQEQDGLAETWPLSPRSEVCSLSASRSPATVT